MAVSCTQRLPALGVSTAVLTCRDRARAGRAFLLTEFLFNALTSLKNNVFITNEGSLKVMQDNSYGVLARNPFSV